MENNGFAKELILDFLSSDEHVTAFSLYDGTCVRNVSFPQFAADILRFAGYFVHNNIKNQHIAIAAPGSYSWIVTFFAIGASGNVAVLLNQDLPEDILQWQCKHADISLICCDPSFASNCGGKFAGVDCICFDSLEDTSPIAVEALYSAAPDETIIMLYTSGTTGKSKAVEISSDNWRYGIHNFPEEYTMPGMERVFTPLPLYHIVGLLHVVKTLLFQKTVCLGRGIRYLFMDMAALNPTVLNAVPTIIESLSKLLKKTDAQNCQRYVGSSLKKISYAGAPLKASIIDFLMERGFTITVLYGMTEVSAAATWGSIDAQHMNTVGKFCECAKHRFEDGELLLSGPTLMKGYYKDPDETAKVVQNGWIHTGDLGYCDEDGYLYLTGRKKNVIILSNGENVNPEEIEEKLVACGNILECMVYSDGKGICADVYTDNQDSAAQFVKQYNANSPMYRQIYKVNYSHTPLEKTGSGKIKRKENVYA